MVSQDADFFIYSRSAPLSFLVLEELQGARRGSNSRVRLGCQRTEKQQGDACTISRSELLSDLKSRRSEQTGWENPLSQALLQDHIRQSIRELFLRYFCRCNKLLLMLLEKTKQL